MPVERNSSEDGLRAFRGTAHGISIGHPRNEHFAWIHTGHKDVCDSRMTKMDQNYISFYIFYRSWNCNGLPASRDKEIVSENYNPFYFHFLKEKCF